MIRKRAPKRCRWPVLGISLSVAGFCGCAATDQVPGDVPSAVGTRAPEAPRVSRTEPGSPVRQASAVVPASPLPSTLSTSAPSFGRELSAQTVTEQVLARNPTVTQMAAAVQMAAARYPQVTSLDDPMFSSWVAPASIGSNKVNDSARFEVSQKFSLFGKRGLRGDAAQAQTVAAGYDLENTRLELVESAKVAYADYYFVERALEVNAEGLKLLEEFKQNAETRYKTGQSPQQDVLQADVELGRQNQQRLVLERTRTVAVARLNTLMSLPPESPLPPPVKSLPPAGTLPEPQVLRDAAIARRPDLQALTARISADTAALSLAQKDYYPDVEAMAAYDSFWQAGDDQQRLRPQMGVRMNLPVRLDRRRGAVSEAEGQLMQRRATLTQQQNQIAFDVQQAHAQVRESEQTVKLYGEKILPAAKENVKSAQTAYVTGKIPFLSLIEAQRGLVDLRDRAFQAEADFERRRATLERVVGGPLPGAPTVTPGKIPVPPTGTELKR